MTPSAAIPRRLSSRGLNPSWADLSMNLLIQAGRAELSKVVFAEGRVICPGGRRGKCWSGDPGHHHFPILRFPFAANRSFRLTLPLRSPSGIEPTDSSTILRFGRSALPLAICGNPLCSHLGVVAGRPQLPVRSGRSACSLTGDEWGPNQYKNQTNPKTTCGTGVNGTF
jgi:hypothetical protein